MAALESADGDDLLTSEDEATWRSLEAPVKTILPDAELFASEDSRELSDHETGIQVALYPGRQVSLSIPYWYEGPEADRMVETLRAVVRAVEESTGLVAFDPQAEEPFIGGGDAIAAQTFQDVHDSFVARGVEPGRAAAPEPTKQPLWRRLFRS